MFSIFLGWQSACWLNSVVKDVVAGRWKNSKANRFRDMDKFFIAEVGNNFRGDFLIITEFFQRGRSISVRIPQGKRGQEWRSFGKALDEMLNPKSKIALMVKGGLDAETHGNGAADSRSFADVLRSNKNSCVKGAAEGISDAGVGRGPFPTNSISPKELFLMRQDGCKLRKKIVADIGTTFMSKQDGQRSNLEYTGWNTRFSKTFEG